MYTLTIIQQIFYKAHVFHTLKNKTLITVLLQFIFLLLISFAYNTDHALCMMSGDEPDRWSDIPQIDEAKDPIRPSEQVIALRRNIQAYAGSLVSHLESRDQIIEESKQEIVQLTQHIDQQRLEIQTLKTNVQVLTNDLRVSNGELASKSSEIKNLTNSIEGYTFFGNLYIEGYKDKIAQLEKQINELHNDLHICKSLLAEAKQDKDSMPEIISSTTALDK